MSRWPSALACLAMLCFGLVAKAVPMQPAVVASASVARIEEPGEPPQIFSPTSQRRLLPGPYLADAIRIIDGDTFETRLAVWLGLEVVTKIRLAGIDAPEIHGKCPEEKRRALDAKEALSKLLEKAPIRIVDIRPDKYNGRVVARALDRDNRDVSEAMLAAGHAVAYYGGHKTSICDFLGKLTASR